MLATLTLVTFLCTSAPNGADKCEATYVRKWAETPTQYVSHDDECIDALNKGYADLPVTVDSGHYTFAACYRVIKKEGIPKDASYLESLQDSDDSFIVKDSVLEIK